MKDKGLCILQCDAMAADGLVMHGAKASVMRVLTKFSQNIKSSAPEWINSLRQSDAYICISKPDHHWFR